MSKPNIEDISIIIDKLKELKKCLSRYNGSFLDPTESKALEAANTGRIFEYVLNLPDSKEKKNLFELIDGSRNIPGFKYGEYKGLCYAFSNESAIKGLKEKNRKGQTDFHSTQIQPLVYEIDRLSFPFWDYLKANGSWSRGEQMIIEAAIRSNKQSDLDKVIREYDKIKYMIKVESLECESISQKQKGEVSKTRKKIKAKTKKLERKYKPWVNPGDACFIIVCTPEGAWTKGVHFYHDSRHNNLRLRNGSRTETLLTQLNEGCLSPEMIKAGIGRERTKASDVVTHANKLLNTKIRGMDLTRLPDHDVAFVELKSGRYECAIPIQTKEEFDRREIEQATN